MINLQMMFQEFGGSGISFDYSTTSFSKGEQALMMEQ